MNLDSLPLRSWPLLGLDPAIIVVSLAAGLFFQFLLHTQAVPSLGRAEGWLNTPSAHRVPHGSNLASLLRLDPRRLRTQSDMVPKQVTGARRRYGHGHGQCESRPGGRRGPRRGPRQLRR